MKKLILFIALSTMTSGVTFVQLAKESAKEGNDFNLCFYRW